MTTTERMSPTERTVKMMTYLRKHALERDPDAKTMTVILNWPEYHLIIKALEEAEPVIIYTGTDNPKLRKLVDGAVAQEPASSTDALKALRGKMTIWKRTWEREATAGIGSEYAKKIAVQILDGVIQEIDALSEGKK